MNPTSDTNSPPGATTSDRVRWLREQIAEFRKRWPPHSVPPSLVQRLDDLEEELEAELRNRDTGTA